ncbi:MAG: hypothetical protein IJH61_00840, partial [Eubacteriaceae bacterium]|nr:hypothetical protein [Eubacteriaceae bacterium]
MRIIFFLGIIGVVVSFAAAILIFFYYDIFSCVKDLKGYQPTNPKEVFVPSKSLSIKEKLKNVPIENPDLTLVLNDVSMENYVDDIYPTGNYVSMENINTDQVVPSRLKHTEPATVDNSHTGVLEQDYTEPTTIDDSHTGVLEQNY